MLRRDFLRLAVVGTVGAAGVAGIVGVAAHQARALQPIVVGHAAIGAAPSTISLDVTAGELIAAETSRRDVELDAYLADFGLTARDLGIAQRHVTVRSTDLPGPLAEIIEARDRRVVIWDGVVYRLEAA